MPQHPVSREQGQQAVDALHDAGGNATAAAKALGLDRGTFRNRVAKGRDMGLQPHIKPPKPRIRVPARSVYTPEPSSFGKPVRVFVFGCSHDAPNIPDKSRFANAGRLAADLEPDYIVDLGDTLDMDSMSMHAKPGSQDDRDRPYFREEIVSLIAAQNAFESTAPSAGEIPRYHLHGNHEHRAWREEGRNPSAQGVFTTELDQVFARFSWTIKAFREWLYIEGVGFTHAPINMMGREFGGISACQTVAREATHSVVWSHTHRREFVERPKIGIGNAIQVYNVGSSMPAGYLKSYAGLSMTGWSYGFSELTLRDGQIESTRFWSVRELEERYS